MRMKIALAIVVVLVTLNGSFAKNSVPGCLGSKASVCDELKKKIKEFDICEEERIESQSQLKELQNEVDEVKAENEELIEKHEELEKENEELEDENEQLETANIELKRNLEELEKEIAECKKPSPTEASTPPQPQAPKNCLEILRSGKTTNGIYSIDPDGKGPFDVFCDLRSQGGGWAIIQRRNGGSVDFSRGWNDYKNGFGEAPEWWLGLEKIHRLTSQSTNDLRIGLINKEDQSAQALYSGFSVGAESTEYQLTLGPFVEGTAKDSMSVHNNMKFSTKDRDNDLGAGANCAVSLNGGWWYYGVEKCADANLNGLYGKNVFYRSWMTAQYSLKKTAMRVRPSS